MSIFALISSKQNEVNIYLLNKLIVDFGSDDLTLGTRLQINSHLPNQLFIDITPFQWNSQT